MGNSSQSDKPNSQDNSGSRRDLGVRSLTSAVYGRLRSDIIANRLRQGEKLPLAVLQEQFGVSLSVVREALSRLVADGLVVTEEQRGFRVSPISKSDLIDVSRMRIALECMAAELAIEHGDDAWLARVHEAYKRLAGLVSVSSMDDWAEAHAEFHRAVVAACGSPWLMRFRETLFEQSQRYRSVSIDRSQPPVNLIAKEHQEILDAVLARDVTAARSAITAHFAGTLERALASPDLT